MKKLITLFLLTLSLVAFGQVQNLRELSTGKIVFSSTLFKDSELYGYFYVFALDKIDKETTEYEYVLLDKNLNPTFNFKYQDKTHKKVWRKFSDAEYMGEDHITLSSGFRVGNNLSAMLNTTQLISLKEKKVIDEFYLKDNKLISMSESASFDELFDQHKSILKHLHTFIYGVNYRGFTGFLAFEKGVSIQLFDAQKESIWKYQYNDYEAKEKIKGNSFYSELYEKDFFVGHQLTSNKRARSYYQDIKIFNLNASGQRFDYRLQDGKSEHQFTVNKVALYGDDQLQVLGRYTKANSKRTTPIDKTLGLYRVILDKKGNELAKTLFKWEELAEEMKVNQKGKTKGNYNLLVKQFFTFANGSSAILFEKFKIGAQIMGVGGNANTSDMVLVQFDKDFNYERMHLIEKAKTRSMFSTSDYLFSQYLNDKNDVVFFFADKKKVEDSRKKEWILGINKIIDGTYSYEELPMTSEEFDRSVSRAKEGYILIREIDKSKDKGKYEIRLEKLNL